MWKSTDTCRRNKKDSGNMKVRCTNMNICGIMSCYHYIWHEKEYSCEFDTCLHINGLCSCSSSCDQFMVDIKRILEL
jgi:hypothetical protein